MKTATQIALIAAGVLCANSAAMADTRFVHKQGNATAVSVGTETTTGCGLSSSTAATTTGPCTTFSLAYSNAKAAATSGIPGTPTVVRLIIISHGGFTEALTADYTGGGSEILVSPDVFPRLVGPDSGTALVVATGANRVLLDGLKINANSGTTVNGINVNSVGTLEMRNTQMRGFTGFGINFTPSGGTNSDLLVVDSVIGNMSGTCVLIKPTSQTANAAFLNTQVHHCGAQGVRTDATNAPSSFVRAVLSRSFVASVANAAASAIGTGTGTARVLVENTDLMNSGTGAASNGANAQIVLNAATVVGNSTGVSSSAGGGVFSFGNSVVSFNAANGVTPTLQTLK